jgi:hypothetical protein
MYHILVELIQEYYWPSLEPVVAQLIADSRFHVSLRIGRNQKRLLGIFLISRKRDIERKFHALGYEITDSRSGFDAVLCGDTVREPEAYGKALLCNFDHGPGNKTLRYRNFRRQPGVLYHIFAEGQYRIDKFREFGLADRLRIHTVGLPKHDILLNGSLDREAILREKGIPTDKPVVLYAPSYKPTSLFSLAPALPTLLSRHTVVIKLHPYSWSGKYASHNQHRLTEGLAKKHPGIHLVPREDHNILPYLFVADTMISDGSSVINEFLALGRCGIICDLNDVKKAHSDGMPLMADNTSEWLKDSFVHFSDPPDLPKAVEEALNPSDARRTAIERDRGYFYSHLDGHSAERVKDTLLQLLGDRT